MSLNLLKYLAAKNLFENESSVKVQSSGLDKEHKKATSPFAPETPTNGTELPHSFIDKLTDLSTNISSADSFMDICTKVQSLVTDLIGESDERKTEVIDSLSLNQLATLYTSFRKEYGSELEKLSQTYGELKSQQSELKSQIFNIEKEMHNVEQHTRGSNIKDGDGTAEENSIDDKLSLPTKADDQTSIDSAPSSKSSEQPNKSTEIEIQEPETATDATGDVHADTVTAVVDAEVTEEQIDLNASKIQRENEASKIVDSNTEELSELDEGIDEESNSTRNTESQLTTNAIDSGTKDEEGSTVEQKDDAEEELLTKPRRGRTAKRPINETTDVEPAAKRRRQTRRSTRNSDGVAEESEEASSAGSARQKRHQRSTSTSTKVDAEASKSSEEKKENVAEEDARRSASAKKKKNTQPAPAGGSTSRTSSAASSPQPHSTLSTTSNRKLQQMVAPLLLQIGSHKSASFFANPINEHEAPGYYEVILSPTDLRTIKAQLRDGSIQNTTELERELQKMFANAIMFNPWNSDMSEWVRDMQADVEKELMLLRDVDVDRQGDVEIELEGKKEGKRIQRKK